MQNPPPRLQSLISSGFANPRPKTSDRRHSQRRRHRLDSGTKSIGIQVDLRKNRTSNYSNYCNDEYYFPSRLLRCKFIALTPSHFIAIPCRPSRSCQMWGFQGSRTFAHRRTSRFPSVSPFGGQSTLLWSFSVSLDFPAMTFSRRASGGDPSGATSCEGGSLVLGAVMSSERYKLSARWES
jgi:hypothetical protein